MSSLALIVPMYNPHNDWFDAVCDLITFLDSNLKNIEYSVVIVNDGSTNFDELYIEKIKKRTNKIIYFSYPKNQGKGYAIRYGLSKIKADYYIYSDIDFPFGYEVIKNMYQIFNNTSNSLIIGLRGNDYFNLLPIKRKIISLVLININFVLTGFKIHDTQAGIKGFDKVAKDILLATKTNEFLFDFEFIHICLRKKINYISIHRHIEHLYSIIYFNFIRNTILHVVER